MGRDKILKKIKKSARLMVAFGMMFIIGGIAFVIGGFIETVLFLFALLFLGIGITLFVFGVKQLADPSCANAMKNNPEILKMADEVFGYTKYEDDFLIISDNVIANKNNIYQMAYIDEVYQIYLNKTSVNFINAGSEIVLETKNPLNSLRINVYAKSKKKKEKIYETLSLYCKNAYFGYTAQGREYLEQKRKERLPLE